MWPPAGGRFCGKVVFASLKVLEGGCIAPLTRPSGVRVQRVQKVLRVQSVVISPSAMSMKSALRERLPASQVILRASEESRCVTFMRQTVVNTSRREGAPSEQRSATPIYHLLSIVYLLSSTIMTTGLKRLALSLKISYNFFYAVSYSTKTYALKGIPQ